MMKSAAASLDGRTIADIASYYASLHPSRPAATGNPAKPVRAANSRVSPVKQASSRGKTDRLGKGARRVPSATASPVRWAIGVAVTWRPMALAAH